MVFIDEIDALSGLTLSSVLRQLRALRPPTELTRGQPWLVNALARQLTEVIEPDRARTLTVQQVEAAKELLIHRQDTHVDSLAARLREPRVRAVVEPMLAGGTLSDLPEEDRQLAVDLGLPVGPRAAGSTSRTPSTAR